MPAQRVEELRREAVVALYRVGRLMVLAEFVEASPVEAAAIRGADDQFQAALNEWLTHKN